MTAITGSDSVIGLKVASTFGTAVNLTTGDKLEVESLNQSTNPTELSANPIGSGATMQSDAQQGAISPTISVEKIQGYNDAGVAAEALFFGGESVMTMAGGYYSHSFLHNETFFNGKFATVGIQYAAQSIMEFASCIPTRFTRTWANPPDYSRIGFDLLANNRVHTSTTNTYGAMETLTVADATRVILQPDDAFRINLRSDSALTSAQTVAVTSIVSEALKPHQHQAEIKGSAGNGQAVATGSPPYTETITITLKNVADHTFITGARDGTEYKADLTITDGSYSWKYGWPRLKLIQDPQYNLANSGANPLTLTFQCLFVDSSLSVPAGHIDRYPWAIVTNTKSAAYLA